MKFLTFISAAAMLLASVRGDIYLHNPRGSNNRYISDPNDPEVENADRLFDSQNNNDGGYDHSQEGTPTDRSRRIGYYVGSELVVQWSSQHACGRQSTTNCEMVLQYMCSPPELESLMAGDTSGKLRWPRDGTSNTDMTYNADDPTASEIAARGMHEPWYNYHGCDRRRRNRGLFIADRDLNTNDARSTRQNNNANRDGLECPEERDYYPYWAPSPWVDIAILTNEIERCEYYWNNTGNTNPIGQCVRTDSNTITPTGQSLPEIQPPITATDCAQESPSNGNEVWGWVEEPPKFGNRVDVQGGDSSSLVPNVPFYGGHLETREECLWFQGQADRNEITQEEATRKCKASLNGPLCRENRWQRDNHLGYISGGYMANFTWLIPNTTSDHCVFRIRYNISTSDYDSWDTFSEANADEETGEGSLLEQDQLVQQWLWDYPIELALNTNQYGRTFQDRSHTFRILERDFGTYPEQATIHNLNVRGKRGHITQTYPSPTLSFTHDELTIAPGDFVHFQWEGASTYPDDYFGGGDIRSDRTNILQIESMKNDRPMAFSDIAEADRLFNTEAEFKYYASAGQVNPVQTTPNCKTLQQLMDDYNLDDSTPGTQGYYNRLRQMREDGSNCFWLNQANAYFPIDATYFAPKQFNQPTGTSFYFMSSRNNIPGIQRMKGAIHVV